MTGFETNVTSGSDSRLSGFGVRVRIVVTRVALFGALTTASAFAAGGWKWR